MTRQCEMDNEYAQQCLANAVAGSDYCAAHEIESIRPDSGDA